jgi:molybdopterin molybdotransferase
MVSVDEASRIAFSFPFKPVTRIVPIADAVGRVLAVEVKADRDFPPFDRVAMDGIAIAYERFKNGQVRFRVEATQAAGEPQKSLQDPANAIEVMTGSILPGGTDTVIIQLLQ